MKFFILLTIALVFFAVDAKKKKHPKHELATTKHKITGPFRMPVFAIRMPIFGAQEIVRPSSYAFNDAVPKEKLKTVTKTSNSTKGPYKTFTVVSETKSTNKSNPMVYGKVIKSITTMNGNNTKGKKFKFPNFRATRIRIFNPMKIFGGMGFGDDDDDKLDDGADANEKECSETKLCQSNQYCDAFFKVCKKKVVPYGACSQKDQCSKEKGEFECSWGRCVKGTPGIAGTFCDKESDCKSTIANEELGCFTQNDISRFSKVCVPKLGEGATCGRTAGIFAMFEKEEDDDRCQGNLVCRAVGFFGRKACIRDISKDQHKYIEAIKKHKKTSKHKKHH